MWDAIGRVGGEVIRGVTSTMATNQWLQMDDENALANIRHTVSASTVEHIDFLDESLLRMAATHFDPTQRKRLIKFYTFFKMCELDRFGTFRGFPAI